jgi:hypothetical protein
VREADRTIPSEVSVFLGFGIFFFIALLCIVAFFGGRKQHRRYEETGSLDPDD